MKPANEKKTHDFNVTQKTEYFQQTCPTLYIPLTQSARPWKN